MRDPVSVLTNDLERSGEVMAQYFLYPVVGFFDPHGFQVTCFEVPKLCLIYICKNEGPMFMI